MISHVLPLLILTVVAVPTERRDEDTPTIGGSLDGDAATIVADNAYTSEKGLDVADAAVQSSDTQYWSGLVDRSDIGLQAVEDEEFVFSGPDQLCMVTDLAPEPFLQPCYGRDTADEEEPEEEQDESQTAESEFVVITVTQSDFAELPLVPAQVHLQPDPADGAWTMVNIDTIALTSGEQQVLNTEVLGFPVAVRATPVEFSWDFGDGSAPLVTTDPGARWPDHTVAHVYTQPSDAVSVSLTTTWVGEFQVNGLGPWIPIAGTAQTTSESEPFEVVEVTTRLVPGPQAGDN